MIAAVFPNFQKKNAYTAALEVCGILNKMGIGITVDERYGEYYKNIPYVIPDTRENAAGMSDVIIAIGGDGTILRCSDCASDLGKPLLGINTGRLGFMASMETDELYYLNKLVTGDYTVDERMMLDAEIIDGDGRSEHHTALNDVIVSCPYSAIADFEVSVGGRTVSRLRADGVIFSTPTGSTAYGVSAGGPILEPCLDCIEFTPICPHSLSSRTILFSSAHRLELRHESEKNDIYFTVDGKPGRPIENSDRVIISKSEKKLKLIDIKGFSFYDAVNNKLMRPIK